MNRSADGESSRWKTFQYLCEKQILKKQTRLRCATGHDLMTRQQQFFIPFSRRHYFIAIFNFEKHQFE